VPNEPLACRRQRLHAYRETWCHLKTAFEVRILKFTLNSTSP